MKRLKRNQLLITILGTITFGITLLAVFLSISITSISNDAYTKSYTANNEILITELKAILDETSEHSMNAFRKIETSNYAKQYFTETSSNSENYYNLNHIYEELEEYDFLNGDIKSNLSILGKNGTYFSLTSSSSIYNSNKSILQNISEYASPAQKRPQYFFMEKDNLQGICIFKTIYDEQHVSFVGYALIFINESDLKLLYNSFIDKDINKIYLLDSSGKIISSNSSEELGSEYSKLRYRAKQALASDDSITYDKHLAYFTKKIYYSDFLLTSIIDINHLTESQNLMPSTIFIVVLFILIISIIMYFFISKSIRPIYTLIHTLPKVSKGDFSGQLDIKGGYEVQELASAYNVMLNELNTYFYNLKKIEEQKRLAEIYALQMQIRPHFIYNTLAIVKHLIEENQNSKAIESIEALILLLRSTIGNKKEYTQIKDEITMLQSYISLQKLRHGNNIQVNFFFDEQVEKLYIPQMLIQPFIENTFFHAFPTEREGFLNIFIQNIGNKVIFQLIDNGIGFAPDAVRKEEKNSLSGLGIQNVSDRIQTMFGEDYGVTIISAPQMGTTIKIQLPSIKIPPNISC